MKSKPTLSKAQAAELRERLRGLTPAQADCMRKLMQLHAAGDRRMFAYWLLELAEQAPQHPEVLLWQGIRHLEEGAPALAAQALAAAVAQRADDFRLWGLLAQAQTQAGDDAAAQHSLRTAQALARSAGQWLQLSLAWDRLLQYVQAQSAADQALRLDPQLVDARLQRARCHKILGDAAAAAADCRAVLAGGRDTGRAWFALLDLKTVQISAAERATLAATAARTPPGTTEYWLLEFALGKALEDAGEYADALAALHRANRAVRRAQAWDRAAFASRIADICAHPPQQQAPAQGREVIFIVGLPRTGTTLIEQVLAAHPAVEGAGELSFLPQVIEAESRRRGAPLSTWAARASAADWARLGQEYLRLSAPWRRHKAIATDKLPDNWQYISAIRAMLPEARIIDCRRELLESCWSCYKQLFAPGLVAWSYDWEDLAAYAHASVSAGDAWAQAHPAHLRIQSYEALVTDPETEIRQLLAFCGLPFAEECLAFQQAPRAIRTPSALQVREPLQRISRPAAAYGDLLAPLRAALQQT